MRTLFELEHLVQVNSVDQWRSCFESFDWPQKTSELQKPVNIWRPQIVNVESFLKYLTSDFPQLVISYQCFVYSNKSSITGQLKFSLGPQLVTGVFKVCYAYQWNPIKQINHAM